LRDLRDTIDNPRFREVLTAMTEDMEGGKVLSQCMVAHPEVFDNVFVSLVRAGEQTGRMPEVFESLASALKWQDELTSQTKRLLIYPAMVLAVVIAVIGRNSSTAVSMRIKRNRSLAQPRPARRQRTPSPN